MTTYEARPPQVTALRFDGGNADEIGQLIGHAGPPEVHTDDTGPYLDVVQVVTAGELSQPVRDGDWVVMQDGFMSVLSDEQFTRAWRPAQSPGQPAAPAPGGTA